MTSNLLLTSEIQSQMNFALQNSFQAAKSQENNANSLRTAADQQRQSKKHTRESLHFNGNHEFKPPKQ